MDEGISEEVQTEESVEVEVEPRRQSNEAKGPDPAAWGDPEERLQYDIERGKIDTSDLISDALREKVAVGEDPVVELDDGRVVKGPDPAKWGVPQD